MLGDFGVLLRVFPRELQHIAFHIRRRREVKSGITVRLDDSQRQQALIGNEIRKYRSVFFLVQEEMCWLVIFGDFHRCMTAEISIALHDHRLAAGEFNSVDEFTLQCC